MTPVEYPIHPDVYLDARRPSWAAVERASLVRGTPFVVWVNIEAVEILQVLAPWVLPPVSPPLAAAVEVLDGEVVNARPRPRGPRIGRTVRPEGKR